MISAGACEDHAPLMVARMLQTTVVDWQQCEKAMEAITCGVRLPTRQGVWKTHPLLRYICGNMWDTHLSVLARQRLC